MTMAATAVTGPPRRSKRPRPRDRDQDATAIAAATRSLCRRYGRALEAGARAAAAAVRADRAVEILEEERHRYAGPGFRRGEEFVFSRAVAAICAGWLSTGDRGVRDAHP